MYYLYCYQSMKNHYNSALIVVFNGKISKLSLFISIQFETANLAIKNPIISFNFVSQILMKVSTTKIKFSKGSKIWNPEIYKTVKMVSYLATLTSKNDTCHLKNKIKLFSFNFLVFECFKMSVFFFKVIRNYLAIFHQSRKNDKTLPLTLYEAEKHAECR